MSNLIEIGNIFSRKNPSLDCYYEEFYLVTEITKGFIFGTPIYPNVYLSLKKRIEIFHNIEKEEEFLKHFELVSDFKRFPSLYRYLEKNLSYIDLTSPYPALRQLTKKFFNN